MGGQTPKKELNLGPRAHLRLKSDASSMIGAPSNPKAKIHPKTDVSRAIPGINFVIPHCQRDQLLDVKVPQPSAQSSVALLRHPVRNPRSPSHKNRGRSMTRTE